MTTISFTYLSKSDQFWIRSIGSGGPPEEGWDVFLLGRDGAHRLDPDVYNVCEINVTAEDAQDVPLVMQLQANVNFHVGQITRANSQGTIVEIIRLAAVEGDEYKLTAKIPVRQDETWTLDAWEDDPVPLKVKIQVKRSR